MSEFKRVMISKEFKFEASHVLPRHTGKCSRLHGHSWVGEVTISGFINPTTGIVVDFYWLGDLLKRCIVDELDHQHLGCGVATIAYEFVVGEPRMKAQEPPAILGPTFYPSSENLVLRLAQLLEPFISSMDTGWEYRCQLEMVSLKETCTSEATWHRSLDKELT